MVHEVADVPQAQAVGFRRAHGQGVAVLEAERRRQRHAASRLEKFAHLLQHFRAPRSHLGSSHLVRPERARVVDVDVDLSGVQSVERHERAERLHERRRPAGFVLHPAGDGGAQDVLLGEALRTDDDRPFPVAEQGRRERYPGVGVQQSDGSQRRGKASATAPGEADLDRPHQPVQQQGQAGGGHAADQDRGVVARLQPAEDVVAETGRPDRGRQRRDAHHPDRRGADARHDDRHRQGQLDQQELLPGGHADAARRFRKGGVDAGDPGDGVAQHREHAVQGQPHDGRQEPDALQIEGGEHRHHGGQQRQARHCLDDAGQGQGRLLQPGDARRRDAERHADARAQQQRQEGELQVRGQVRGQQCEQLVHDGPPSGGRTAGHVRNRRACAGVSFMTVCRRAPRRSGRPRRRPVAAACSSAGPRSRRRAA